MSVTESESLYPHMISELDWMLNENVAPDRVSSRSMDLGAMQHQQREPNQTVNLAKSLALRIHPSYQATFGDKWGEGAVSKDASHQVVPIRDFLAMSPRERDSYSLFYEPSAFAARFEHEMFPEEGRGYIAVAEYDQKKIVGAAWGVRASMPHNLERIGTANYNDTPEHAQLWNQKIAPQLEKKVAEIMQRRGQKQGTVLYWDEIYTIPSLHQSGSGIFMQLTGELLSSIFKDTPFGESVPLMFRTSEDSAMGGIADTLVTLGVLEKIAIEGDDPNIVYYAGSIHAAYIAAARMVSPARVFRAMLAAQKSARMQQ